MQASGLGGAGRVPGRPGERRAAAQPLSPLVRASCFSLALAEVNRSALTIFALPLYKRPGSGPADPITSLSGNKCLTIRPYWVWEINPFHLPTPTPSPPALEELARRRYCCSTSRGVSQKLLCVSKGSFSGFDVAVVVVLLARCSFSRFIHSFVAVTCVCV